MTTEAQREYHRTYQRARVERNRQNPLPETVEHGTVNAYQNYACRCEPCSAAQREYNLPRIAERRERGLDPQDPRHGTYNAYVNYSCRCERCKEANRLYAIDYKLRNGLITLLRAEELRLK